MKCRDLNLYSSILDLYKSVCRPCIYWNLNPYNVLLISIKSTELMPSKNKTKIRTLNKRKFLKIWHTYKQQEQAVFASIAHEISELSQIETFICTDLISNQEVTCLVATLCAVLRPVFRYALRALVTIDHWCWLSQFKFTFMAVFSLVHKLSDNV